MGWACGVRADAPPTLAPSAAVMCGQQHGGQHEEHGRPTKAAACSRAQQRQHEDGQSALDAEVDGTVVHWEAAAVVQVEAQLPDAAGRGAARTPEVLVEECRVGQVRATAVTVDELAAAEGRRLVVGAALWGLRCH